MYMKQPGFVAQGNIWCVIKEEHLQPEAVSLNHHLQKIEFVPIASDPCIISSVRNWGIHIH